MKSKIMAAAALALVLAGGAMPAEAAVKTLTVGVRDDIMHFGYLNPNTGKYYGFEIDLAEELSKKLGYEKVEYVTVDPDNRKDALLDGRVDCLIAAYSVTETRMENFDFSPAYYMDYSSVIVEKSTMYTTMKDLVGRRIGVLDGADTAPKMHQKWIETGLITEEDAKGTELVRMEFYADISVALEEGKIDAACMDGCIARAFMEDDREILKETIGEEFYAVATQKGSELSEPMARAVQKLLDDGTIDALIGKWS